MFPSARRPFLNAQSAQRTDREELKESNRGRQLSVWGQDPRLHLTLIPDLTSGADTSRSRAIFLWFTSRCSVSVNADASGCILMGRSGDALEATT